MKDPLLKLLFRCSSLSIVTGHCWLIPALKPNEVQVMP
jgi:hypothetical protein